MGSFQSATSGAILRTEHLGRVADDVTLVADASIAVNAAEILAVVGPSGSGKTSFLRLLNRLDEPTSGTVYLEGTDYRQIVPRELRRKVGMVTQSAFLFPGSVADNVRFGPRQRGEILSEDAVASMLVRVGLAGYATRDVANLSGGESQRVSIARALANSPIVLLMDEPTSALDDDAKAGIESLIHAIVMQTQLTCITVTHDVAQAERLADRVMVLSSGRLTRIGEAEQGLYA